jgi:2-haloacid dehalogenase
MDWPAWHLQHDAGLEFAATSAELIGRFPHYHAQIEAWFGRWGEMFDGYVPGVVDILHDLSETGVPLFALTNLSHEIAEQTFTMFPETARFQDIIVSGALRLVKPDPAIYAAALERIGAPAEDVFFTDDSAANIAAAKAMGFRTHLFDGAPGLRESLRRYRLLK